MQKKIYSVKSAYIHIPFCKKICSYCDFCKNFYNSNLVIDYLNSLEIEIEKNYNKEVLKTIYIGGGTPSCLNLNELDKLFSIIKKLKLNSKYEFTFEFNYEDITDEKLRYLKDNKVNRISIGVQSFNDKFSDILNRNINKKDIINKVLLAKKYFNNINIDLMYGIKNQTIEDIKNDLDILINLEVNHISIYCLILEDNTLLKINNYKELCDEKQNKMYYFILNYLNKNGYINYEISNFSKKGYESKHNLTYWNNERYYGFGLGSSGFLNNYRYDNTRSLSNYKKNNFLLSKEIISNEQMIKDEIMLNLRKKDGINKNKFLKKYNKDIKELFDISYLFENKYIKENKKNIYIPRKYLFVSNEIIIKFIDGYKDSSQN